MGDDDPVSPLVLDLDGDGVEADALAYFDHEGDGWNELSRWASADDGMLVWDRNGDGVISDGSELFGNNTVLANGQTAAHGFAALADLDSNGDGVVDASDTHWGGLRVQRWTDANSDGIVQAGEMSLVTLASLGIASLSTGFKNSDHVDGSGNEHRQVGSYTSVDGTVRTMSDVWFVTDEGSATYDKSLIPAHSAAVLALPDIAGGGRVYDLRDAMALDDAGKLEAPFDYAGARGDARTLRGMVEAFVAVDADGAPVLDEDARLALAEKILLRWAGAEGVSSGEYWGGSGMYYTTAEKVAVVEAFQGGMWREGENYRHPAYKTAQKVERGFLNHLERLHANLMMASHLKDLNAAVSVRLKSGAVEGSVEASDYELDFGAVEALLAAEGNARRGAFLRSLAALYGNTAWVLESLAATAPGWSYEYAWWADWFAAAVFDGNTVRADDYTGDCGCSGGVRDNVFWTTDGGADNLRGRGGDDTYYLDIGTGHDVIEERWRDSDWGGDAGDEIRLAAGVAPSAVRLSRTRWDLVVSLAGAGGKISDSLTVKDYFATALARVERVAFADGTVWGAAEFEAAVLTGWDGTDGSDAFELGVDAASDVACGGAGGDVYWLGRGGADDAVDEAAFGGGAAGDVDVVRLASDVALAGGGIFMSSPLAAHDLGVVTAGGGGSGAFSGGAYYEDGGGGYGMADEGNAGALSLPGRDVRGRAEFEFFEKAW